MKKILALSILLALTITSFGQEKRNILLGIQPGITKEKFYAENEFDLNVVPIFVQFSLSKRTDLRLVSYANFRFGGANQFSDLGMNLAAPIFLKKKENLNQKSSGFYIAPVLGLGRNLVADHYTTTVAMEPGFLFPTKNRFTLSLGMQLGGSYFLYDNEPNVLRQHFGFKVNLGFWL